MALDKFRIKRAQLPECSKEELLTYTYMLVIAQFDGKLADSLFEEGSLETMVVEIQKAGKNELIEMASNLEEGWAQKI